MSSTPNQNTIIPILNSTDAASLDQFLFRCGYTPEQLIELAGLTCAQVLHHQLQQQQLSISPNNINILVCVGPGNNGADGLTLARHLQFWGYNVAICAPKLLPQLESILNITITDDFNPKTITTDEYLDILNDATKCNVFHKLLFLALQSGCKVIPTIEHDIFINTLLDKYNNIPTSPTSPTKNNNNNLFQPHIIVDAIFGFSFKANSITDIRAPFNQFISLFASISKHKNDTSIRKTASINKNDLNPLFTTSPTLSISTTTPILYSIDIPSGWDVNNGDNLNTQIDPHLMISLTAPKPCVKYLNSTCLHYIGGRFIPIVALEKFKLTSIMKLYQNDQQFFLVNKDNVFDFVTE